MPIATTCPNCKAIFRLGDDLAGKTVRCQKCSDTFVVPNAESDTSMPGIPTPTEDPAEGAMAYAVNPKAKKPVVNDVEDDDDPDEDQEERRSTRRQPDRDRPSRRYARERKSAKAGGGGALVWVLAIAGVSFFLCIGCSGVGLVAYLIAAPGRGANNVAVNNNAPPPAFPPGGINVLFGNDNRFRQNNQLTMMDPITPEGSRHKVYMLHAQANRTYQIDMVSNQIDCYLVVLDDVNMVVARDDDSGGGLNARIIFTPVRTAFFRIEAANCPPRINPKSPPTGPYTLTIEQR